MGMLAWGLEGLPVLARRDAGSTGTKSGNRGLEEKKRCRPETPRTEIPAGEAEVDEK